MDRQEHLDWCKQRALKYVDMGDVNQALASMMSDLGKHDETRSSVGICMLGLMETSEAGMRNFINGFN